MFEPKNDAPDNGSKKDVQSCTSFFGKVFFFHTFFIDRSEKSPLTPTPKDRCFHPGDEGIGGQDFGDDLYLRRLFFFSLANKTSGALDIL